MCKGDILQRGINFGTYSFSPCEQKYVYGNKPSQKKKFLACMRYVNNMFSFYPKDGKLIFDNGGYSFEHFTDTLSLAPGNLLMHVILPELLTYYKMINNNCTIKML